MIDQLGIGLAVVARGRRLHAHRIAQVEAHVRHVERVAGHVAQGAGAKLPPAAPLERMIGRMIRPHFRRADELGPVHVRRHCGRVGRPVDALRPDRAVRPDVNFLDRAQRAALEDRGRLAEVVVRPCPGCPSAWPASSRGELAQHAGFVERLGHRLLHEGVLAQLHAHRRGHRVAVVGRADGDRVDALAHLVEHLAEVVILLRRLRPASRPRRRGARRRCRRSRPPRPARPASCRVAGPLAADADAGEADLLDGRPALARGDAAQRPVANAEGRRGLHELSAGCSAGHAKVLLSQMKISGLKPGEESVPWAGGDAAIEPITAQTTWARSRVLA